MNFYRRFPGDYSRDTTHLTLAEHGAYTLLLDSYYSTERPIPSTEFACAICHARTGAEVKVVKKVLAYFFKKRGKQWVNSRAEEEIRFAEHKRKAAKNSIKHRWDRYRRNTNVSQKAHENDTASYSSRNTLQTPDSRLQKSQDQAAAVGFRDNSTAAAFALIGFDKPFGQAKFQQIFLEEFQKPAQWLTMKLEATIQRCQTEKIGIPPQFYDAKHDVEARENASIKKQVPL